MPADSSWKMPVVSPDARSREGSGVVERDPVEIDLDAAVLAHEVDGLPEDGQVRQPEEVELEQPQRLDACISYWVMRVRVGRLLQRHEPVSGSRLMTTPAACVEALRATPSRWRAKSMIRATAGSASTCSRSAG